MVRTRLSVGCGRTLIEDPFRCSFPGFHRFLEYPPFLPALQDVLLQLWEILAGIYRAVEIIRGVCRRLRLGRSCLVFLLAGSPTTARHPPPQQRRTNVLLLYREGPGRIYSA